MQEGFPRPRAALDPSLRALYCQGMKPDETQPRKAASRSTDRDERLKAALKANIARRKAQAAARGAKGSQTEEE